MVIKCVCHSQKKRFEIW